MEFRKIIRFGKGSYVVSLPKTWLKKNNLKKGDTIGIEENHDEVTFTVNKGEIRKKDRRIVINVEDKELAKIKTEIISAYLNNYNHIEILCKEGWEDSKQIKDILRDLAGIEIMEQTSTRIVAHDLININDISINNIIRRMDNIIRGMIEDCNRCILGEDLYESIYSRDDDVNRLFYLAKRVIKNGLSDNIVARILKRNNIQLVEDRLVILRLEKIADRQKRIAKYLCKSKLNKDTLKELKKLYENISNAYIEIMKAYYTKDKEKAFDIEFKSREKVEKCMKFLEENTGCSKGRRYENPKKITDCVTIAKIVENLIGMVSSEKYIARTVIEKD